MFDEYPFSISTGSIATKTPGSHTVSITAYERTIVPSKVDSGLRIVTDENDAGKPFLSMENVNKIVEAYNNNIPVTLRTSYGNLGVWARVTVVTSIIYACAFMCESKTACTYVFEFSVDDGTLIRACKSNVGEYSDNGNDYPVLHINNRNYKINVDSNGFLTASLLESSDDWPSISPE